MEEPLFLTVSLSLPLGLSPPSLSLSQGKDEREPADESADERLRRRAYERGCQRLKKRIEGEVGFKGHRGQHQEQGSRVLDPSEGPQQFFSLPALLVSSSVVEELQVQILKLLLNNKDKSTVGDRREGTPWRGLPGGAWPVNHRCVCVCFRARPLATSSSTSSASSCRRTPATEG